MKYSNNKGITLIELIISVAILSVLIVMLIPAINGYIEKSRAERCQHTLEQIMATYEGEKRVTNIQKKIPSNTGIQLMTLYRVVNNVDSEFFPIKMVCPSKGNYIIEGDTVKCSYHDNSVTAEKELSIGATNLYSMMEGIIKQIQDIRANNTPAVYEKMFLELFGNKHPTNDDVRKYMLKQIGGTWPPITYKDKTYYMQVHNNPKDLIGGNGFLNEQTIVYANSAKDESGNRWEVKLIYHIDEQRWYAPGSGSAGIYVAQKAWDTVKKELEDNHWVPIS